MKKAISLILLVLIIKAFTACTYSKNLTSTPGTSSQETQLSENSKTKEAQDDKATKQTPDFMKNIESLSDKELLDKYINGLEVGLIGKNELLFENPDDIPSETLFMFFLYSLDTPNSSKYKDYERHWLNRKDNMFHIPIKDISDVLDHYFEHYSLDPKNIYDYSVSENAILTRTISGFGGDVWTKVKDKKFDYDKLTLVVDFYENDRFQKVVRTKQYVIRFYESGYYFLSIIKK